MFVGKWWWFNWLIVLSLKGSDGMMKTHGESCEEGEPCLGAPAVTCLISGVCGCSSSDDMTYDPGLEACLVNLGKHCRQDKDCIQGAWCDSNICRCDYGYYASSNGTCLTQKSYKESCIQDIECGVLQNSRGQAYQRNLICLQGICQCDKKSDQYSSATGTCVGLVDSECPLPNNDDDCTENAECRINPLGKITCQCKSGYAKTSHGICGKGYGQVCGGRSKTIDGGGGGGDQVGCADIHFICIEGKCTCKYPLHQTYDEKTQECLSLVSGPCTFPRSNIQMNLTLTGFHDFQKCVKNAHCVDKEFYSECECKPGFVTTKSGTCTPDYGEPCEAGDCDPDNNSQLFCRNGLCDCLDLLQVYDPSIKKCRGLVGSRCTFDKPDCVEFSSCIVPDSKLPGKCLCDKYSQEVVNRTCDYHL